MRKLYRLDTNYNEETQLPWYLKFCFWAACAAFLAMCAGCSMGTRYVEGPPPPYEGPEIAYDESQDPAMVYVKGHEYFYP